MMDIPLVTIGIPVYNAAFFLNKTLSSLLAQTYQNIEIIISDDASTDNSLQIIKDFAEKDRRIKYFSHTENKGPVFNFNFLLEQASGEYFMWAGHDDVFDKSWVDILLKIQLQKNTPVSFGKLIPVNERYERLSEYKFKDYPRNFYLRNILYFLKIEELGKCHVFYGLYKRDFLNKIGGFQYVDDIAGHDYLQAFKVLQYGNVSFTDDVFLEKMHMDGSLSFNIKPKKSFINRLYALLYPKNIYILIRKYLKITDNKLLKTVIICIIPFKLLIYYFYSIVKCIMNMHRWKYVT